MSGTSTVARRIPRSQLVASTWNSGIDLSTTSLTAHDVAKVVSGLQTASTILRDSGGPQGTALMLIENLQSGSPNMSEGVDWAECSRLESAIKYHSRKSSIDTSLSDFLDQVTNRKAIKRTRQKRRLQDGTLSASAAPTMTEKSDQGDMLVEQQELGQDEQHSSEFPGRGSWDLLGKLRPDESGETDDESSWEGCSTIGDDADRPLEIASALTQASELPGILSDEGPAVSARGGATRWNSGIDLSNLTMTEQELTSLRKGLHKAANILYPGRGPQATASTLLDNLETRPDNVSEGIEWDDFLKFKRTLKYHGEKTLAYKSVSTFYDKLKEHDKARNREEKVERTREQRRLRAGSTYGSQPGVRANGRRGGSTGKAVPAPSDPSQTNTNMDVRHESESTSDAAEEVSLSWSREECGSLLQKVKEYIGPAVRSVPVRLSENLEDMMTTGSGDLLNNIEWQQYTNWRNSASNTRSQLLKDIVHGLDSQLVKPESTASNPKFPKQLRSLMPADSKPKSDDYFDSRWAQGIKLECLGLGQADISTTAHHIDQLTCQDKHRQRRITATELITNLLLHPENMTQNIAGEDYLALLEEAKLSQGVLSDFRSRVRAVLSGSCYSQSVPGLPPSPADSEMVDVVETPALPWGVVDSTRPWDGMESTRPPGLYD